MLTDFITIEQSPKNYLSSEFQETKEEKEVVFLVDKQKVEQAVRLYLEGIGEDVNREGLLDTPSRIARMCEEIYGGLDQDRESTWKNSLQ